MRAVVWEGKNNVKVAEVPDPGIVNPHDAIVKVTLTAICGSDLHLYNGFIPTMKSGDVLGHEFMGEVVEVGNGVTTISRGDRVVVPFVIACGHCFFCQRELWSLCDNSNPNSAMLEKAYGDSGAGLFGYHEVGWDPSPQAAGAVAVELAALALLLAAPRLRVAFSASTPKTSSPSP